MKRFAFIVVVALSPAASAMACGVCIEDKVAVTYDHEVVARAAGKGQSVVFVDIQTRGPARAAVERTRRAARDSAGVDAASVRVATDPPALSFALDTRVQAPQAAVTAIARAAGRDTTITLLRVVAPVKERLQASAR
jgi:hypothetical protein